MTGVGGISAVPGGMPQPGAAQPPDPRNEDLAARLTFGAFSLASASSRLDLDEQMYLSTLRKVKRKAAGTAFDETVKALGRGYQPPVGAPAGATPPVNPWDVGTRLYNYLDLSKETRAVLNYNNTQFLNYSATCMFGLDRVRAEFGRNTDVFSRQYWNNAYRTLSSSARRQVYWRRMTEAAAKNFEKFRWLPKVAEIDPKTGKAIMETVLKDGKAIEQVKMTNPTLGGFMRFGVVGEMFRRMSMFAATGKGFFEAAMGALSFGFLVLNTGLQVKKAHDRSAERGEGIFKRALKMAYAGVMETFKCIVSMQISAVAYALTYGAVTIPIVGAFAAMAGAGVAGVLAYNLQNKILGRSVQKSLAEEQQERQGQQGQRQVAQQQPLPPAPEPSRV